MSVTLVGTFLTAGDLPHSGCVYVQPDIQAVDTATPAVISQAAVVGELDDLGSFAVAVRASDDPSWEPAPIPYIITVRLDGQDGYAFMAYIDGDGATVDITDLIPLDQAPTFPPAVPQLPPFHYQKSIDVLDIPNAWTVVNTLTVAEAVEAGTYMFGVSLTWRFDVTNRSAEFRFSDDGGQTWGETYAIEPSDAQDLLPFQYQYPYTREAGPVDVVMEARKPTAQGQLDVTFCDLWVQRVA